MFDAIYIYIDYLYVLMNILIYILEFKHLHTYYVTLLLNIVSPEWLYRRGSNSLHLNFNLHRLKIFHLGNRYRSITKQSLIHFQVDVFFQKLNRLFSWHFGRTQQSKPFASHSIGGDENIKNEDHYSQTTTWLDQQARHGMDE